MRIVDRKTFLAMPAGTVFAKFNPHCIEQPEIKWETMGKDYVTQDLIPSFEGATSGDDDFAIILAMADEGKESPPVDYDNAGRDGLFDADQLFAVWSAEDTRRLIARLEEALKDATAGGLD